MVRGGYTYILTNKSKSVLYTGVTSNLKARVREHKLKIYPDSFTSKYNCSYLVWYKGFGTIIEAIEEEKRIKGGSRKGKENLINVLNPQWLDLYEELEEEL